MRKSEIFLLDANVLIALATPDHTSHARAVAWFGRDRVFATCPITQGALVRFYMRFAEGASIRAAKQLLERICSLATHQFWADDLPFLLLPEKGVIGYRQVTDAYLVGLAKEHNGRLATLDEALAAVHSDATLI